MRIVSLVPGATEVIAILGHADDLVGISHECDYPPTIRHAPVLVQARVAANDASSAEIDRMVREAVAARADLYALDHARFRAARPDLVIAQELCDVCAITPDGVQAALRACSTPPRLLTLHPARFEDVLQDLDRIGQEIGEAPAATALATALRDRLSAVQASVASCRRPSVVCLEWLDPPFIAGHWVPEMIAHAGGTDVLGEAGAKSRPAAWADIAAASPEVVVLAPCGFSIDRTLQELPAIVARPEWTRVPAVLNDRVFVVDAAAYFSRPGPRLVDGVEILAQLLHPQIFGDALPQAATRVSHTPHTTH
jgi:iron complex transport system substrate-binding protein